MSKKVLGRGLGALIGSSPVLNHSKRGSMDLNPTESAKDGDGSNGVMEIRIEEVHPSSLQPRKTFTEDELAELADSIKSLGILQPLLVRRAPNSKEYELIAGERRLRAAQRVGLKKVPVIVKEASDQDVLEWAMVENLQRADLNPIEEADGYYTLASQFNLTQGEIASRVGKNRATIANSLRLRQLPQDVQSLLRQNLMSVGHAKVLLGLGSAEEQKAAAKQVIAQGLNVRQTEYLIERLKGRSNSKSNKKSKVSLNGATNGNHGTGSADWRQLELELQRTLGTRVHLHGTPQKGRIEIEFYTASDLDRILIQLGAFADR